MFRRIQKFLYFNSYAGFPAVPNKVSALSAELYQKVMMKYRDTYPDDWDVLLKFIRPFFTNASGASATAGSGAATGTGANSGAGSTSADTAVRSVACTLGSGLDLTLFIESQYLDQSPNYREEAVRLLLRSGASAVSRSPSSGKTPMEMAARRQDASCVMALVEHGADPAQFHLSDVDTPLHAALALAVLRQDCDTKLLQQFVDLYRHDSARYAYLNPSTRDDRGDTLLHLIAREKSSAKVLRVVERLRLFNIDPNVVNRDGKRAEDYLAPNDRRRRFLRATELTQATSRVSTAAEHRETDGRPIQNDGKAQPATKPIPCRAPAKFNPREDCRRRLNDIVQKLEQAPVIRPEEFELSESESDDDSDADDGMMASDRAEEEDEVLSSDGSDSSQSEDEGGDDGGAPGQHQDGDEVDASVFDNLEWEVECTAEVWKTLLNKKLDRKLKRRIVKKVRLLATGEWLPHLCKPMRPVDGIQLYEIKLSKGMRIIWEVAVAFSERRSEMTFMDDENRKIYAEIIRVWDVITDHDNLHRAVKRIARSNVRGQQSIVRKRLRGLAAATARRLGDQDTRPGNQPKSSPGNHDSRRGNQEENNNRYSNQQNGYPSNQRKRLPALYMEEAENDTDVRIWTPPASCVENEYHIMKFYAFNTALVSYILEHEGTKVDFPFNVTDIEYSYIRLNPKPPTPLLVLGRSGTGKTTCCMYRLWIQFLAYWEKAFLADGALIPRREAYTARHTAESESESESDDDGHEAETSEEEDAEGVKLEYDHLHQIFVTKNRVLCREVKKNFLHLCRTSPSASSYTDLSVLPNRLQAVPATAYPLFLSSRQFLLLLDGSMPNPFFRRDASGNMKYDIDGWGARETQVIYDLNTRFFRLGCLHVPGSYTHTEPGRDLDRTGPMIGKWGQRTRLFVF